MNLEWIEVDEASNPVGVIAVEEFVIASNRAGCSYVSRAEFENGNILPGTFWIDEQGLRHFILKADAGYTGIIGKEVSDGGGV